MPNYDYKCQECGHVFEVFHSMSQNPELECEKCKGEVKKMIGGGAGIIFKGSGFYVNDYKKKKETPCESCPTSSTGCGKK